MMHRLIFVLWVCGFCVWQSPSLGSTELPDVANVWVDTDMACTGQRTHDPDDCLALYALLRSANVYVAGVSLVYGNTDLAGTDTVYRQFSDRAKSKAQDGVMNVPIASKGAASPLRRWRQDLPVAVAALCAQLETTELTIIALGPLTNIALAVRTCPERLGNVKKLVIVGGRHAGHVFHPAEDAKRFARMRHGPIFRDMNIALDPLAARQVLESGVPILLTPYHLARQFEITASDLRQLATKGQLEAWLSQRSQAWLSYWRDDIGRAGFYPFDLMAVAAVLAPESLVCSQRHGRLKRDFKIGGIWGPNSLLIYDQVVKKSKPLTVCHHIAAGGHEAIRELLGLEASPKPLPRTREGSVL